MWAEKKTRTVMEKVNAKENRNTSTARGQRSRAG